MKEEVQLADATKHYTTTNELMLKVQQLEAQEADLTQQLTNLNVIDYQNTIQKQKE